MNFRNLTALSDEEFYLRNARSCQAEAKRRREAGQDDTADWYDERAQQYIADLSELKRRWYTEGRCESKL